MLYLDDRDLRDGGVERSARALEVVAEIAGGAEKVAVENLEGTPIDTIDPVLDQVAASRCVDVGHLWLDGRDPVPYLAKHLARTRVIHLHGVADRDHRSLARVPRERLDPVVRLLLDQKYSGVVTLEVFGEEDLHTSRAALERSLEALWDGR